MNSQGLQIRPGTMVTVETRSEQPRCYRFQATDIINQQSISLSMRPFCNQPPEINEGQEVVVRFNHGVFHYAFTSTVSEMKNTLDVDVLIAFPSRVEVAIVKIHKSSRTNSARQLTGA